MDLTEAFQLLPEQSTAAVIIHHRGKYYAVRGRRRCVAAGGRRCRKSADRPPLDPQRVIIFDGAMGTMLYNKGVFINQCYDENLRAPDPSGIHKAYRRLGRKFSRRTPRRQQAQTCAVRPRVAGGRINRAAARSRAKLR
jgi:hypothetical protein